MNRFRRVAFIRIAAVTLIMAGLFGPLSWWVSREKAEAEVVAVAQEDSRRLLAGALATDLSSVAGTRSAEAAAAQLAGGLFEIAEIYSAAGDKLAEAMTPYGETLESSLPRHGRPTYAVADYESLETVRQEWVVRVMVPLRNANDGPVLGYFEGIRRIPEWQRSQVQTDALAVAFMVCAAAVLCGAVIYPVVVHLAAENERRARQVLDSHVAMMEALGRAIAKRDSDTGAHNYRVAWMAAAVGESLGLKGHAMQALIAGSFLHDVGKIGIPDAILLKPGRLDASEMAIMRTHVALGHEIVNGAGWLQGAAEVVAGHHEKWNGTGYPLGLAETAIPLAARIFAVVDVFDALSSKRPYKAPMPFDDVMSLLKSEGGQHFDPTVLEAFCALAPQLSGALEGKSEREVQHMMTTVIERHFELIKA